MSQNKRINPFQPVPAKKRKGRQTNQSRPSATQVALRQFTSSQAPLKMNPPKPQPVRRAPSRASTSHAPQTISVRLPVCFNAETILKVLKRDLQTSGVAISQLFESYPVFGRSIADQFIEDQDKLKSDDGLVADPHESFLAKPEIRFKPKPKIEIKPEKRDVEGASKEPEKSPLNGPAEKWSLPLDVKFVKKFDSKTKVKETDIKLKLTKNATNFIRILDAKMFNLASHALPLMEDVESQFSKDQRDKICIACTGVKYNTIAEYRDAWYLRAIKKQRLAKLMLELDPKGDYPSIKKKGKNHHKLKEAIAEVQATFKPNRSATKVELLMLRLFPGFKTSPLYKA